MRTKREIPMFALPWCQKVWKDFFATVFHLESLRLHAVRTILDEIDRRRVKLVS